MCEDEGLREFLEDLADQETLGDAECTPDDFTGGNIDDAYFKGLKDGEVELARQLLEAFFLKGS